MATQIVVDERAEALERGHNELRSARSILEAIINETHGAPETQSRLFGVLYLMDSAIDKLQIAEG